VNTVVEIAAPIVCCLPLLVLLAIELRIAKPADIEEEQ
jgi:hypothetical protein